MPRAVLAACAPDDAPRAAKLLPVLGPGAALARVEALAAERAALPCAAGDADAVQGGVVGPGVRAVAAEWLVEVCWDWKLESTTVFSAVRYLDLYLATTPVRRLARFQGVAVSCLRTAFQRSRDAAARRDLARPAAWAEVCDGAATAGDVSAACRAVAKLLRAHRGVRDGETPKLQLRRLWYQLLDGGGMHAGRVYGARAKGEEEEGRGEGGWGGGLDKGPSIAPFDTPT